MISHDHAFRLRNKIHPYTQDAIIENVVKGGYTSDEQPFWLKYDVRSLEHASIWGTYDEEPNPPDFFYRLYEDAEWYWEENEVAELVKPLATEVEHLFTKMTRIKAFVQKPGEPISAHRDLTPGHQYRLIANPFQASLGGYSGIFQGHRNLRMPLNTRHSDQKYLNLKIPLSADPASGGKPYIVAKDGVKRYLKSEDHFYFLNEYEMFHGCDAVDFYRGVVFIDGILDMDALEAEPKLDFE